MNDRNMRKLTKRKTFHMEQKNSRTRNELDHISNIEKNYNINKKNSHWHNDMHRKMKMKKENIR